MVNLLAQSYLFNLVGNEIIFCFSIIQVERSICKVRWNNLIRTLHVSRRKHLKNKTKRSRNFDKSEISTRLVVANKES